jgi:lipopolysaccharide biosynthesis regulator YciM
MVSTSKSIEQLAEGVYRAMKRTKARKANALRTTRYANAINDLIQREQPRRDFVGDLLRVCAGLQECSADLGEIREELNYAIDAIENKTPASVDLDSACINEEQAEGPHEVAQIRLVVERTPQSAQDYLTKRSHYIAATEPVALAARHILNGGTAA